MPAGGAQCSTCGKVYGEQNRCPSCHAIAAVSEHGPGDYVCAACSAPRVRTRSTPVDSDFADALARKATRDRVLSYVFLPVGALSSLVGLGLGSAALAWLEGGFRSAGLVVGSIALGIGVLGLWVAGRALRSARALGERVRDARLMLHAGRSQDGVTAGDAARLLRLDEAAADAALTELAKKGQLDLAVDDVGTVRYRVFDAELEEQAEEVSAAQLRQR
ncbi:MAG: hypothetical protein OEZ06_04570 [Myxococcales bacterium]|nr:hypothetical protein [Myxococcales bacterium]